MYNLSKSRTPAADPRSENAKAHQIPEGEPRVVEDGSLPPDAQPITFNQIDWTETALPEYEDRYAVVLDNVLSPSECRTLLSLAESSVDVERMNSASSLQDPWRPAMVSAGAGMEVLDSGYRNSDRLVWDCQEVVDRLWARCLQGDVGETLMEKLAVLDGDHRVTGITRKGKEERWEMVGLGKRMRFLRYGEGQFFKPHGDGHYSEEVGWKKFKTFFTLHLYLNDSVAEAGEDAELVGGATSFVSNYGSRKVDVDPKAGRVLIFQQRLLTHAGDDVVEGIKYTMRAEIMYELVRP
ncbi:hypothetical protein M406DRAFT_342808 [Cryphonectria parasitica EP155]|uniref:Prolyl 4-hydroxylase alpha subunit domain-containing protein n=1 Tax=Cryphonectria parasitica (strain ATCC 38755 / EP155) TaxID=660469 RepID=A0A9P5CJX6_CRYP1|nr:uncharacterized protein M406DRAFT_342808 [Cryphonectria parasitica EP155]KAF3760592.1 hypothetical protein M406DRAFT_342808 [Cryphonectria parasitica EP155]